MSKAIMISIQPQWVEKILNGEKIIEIRKTMPKCDLPVDVYIYCTKGNSSLYEVWSDGNKKYINYINAYDNGCKLTHYDYYEKLNGKVVAKFTLNRVEEIEENQIYDAKVMKEHAYLSIQQLNDYTKGKKFYAWYIDNLEIFDKPKELSEFTHKKPSFCGIKDKNGLYQCHKCRYGDSYYCECNLKLIKAPQSWCYCEMDW